MPAKKTKYQQCDEHEMFFRNCKSTAASKKVQKRKKKPRPLTNKERQAATRLHWEQHHGGKVNQTDNRSTTSKVSFRTPPALTTHEAMTAVFSSSSDSSLDTDQSALLSLKSPVVTSTTPITGNNQAITRRRQLRILHEMRQANRRGRAKEKYLSSKLTTSTIITNTTPTFSPSAPTFTPTTTTSDEAWCAPAPTNQCLTSDTTPRGLWTQAALPPTPTPHQYSIPTSQNKICGLNQCHLKVQPRRQ